MSKSLYLIIIAIVIIFLGLWIVFQPGWPSVASLIAFLAGGPYIIKTKSEENLKRNLKEKFNGKSLVVITKLIKKIDNKILKKVRSLNIEKLKPVGLSDQYNAFLRKFSKRKNIRIEYILKLFNSNNFKPIISNEVDFTVNIEKELKEIILQDHKGHKIVIKNPKLMWECSCNGNIKKNYNRCPIHKNFHSFKDAKEFSENFSSGLVKIKYDNIEVFWKSEKDLWPPSIDTFNLIMDLKSQGYDKKTIESVVDIGAGTGFLGIWLAKNNNKIKQVHFSDWLLIPLFFSYTNSIHNITDTETQYLLGLNSSWLPLDYSKKINKYDLVICNPPYLPELGFNDLTKESTVAGTQLLKSIIKYGLNIGKEVIISFSELVLPEALSAADSVGINLNQCKIGEQHTVPFRVPIALKRKEYMNKLLNERSLIENPKSEFRYWHKINTYSLKRLPTTNIVE